MKKVSTLCIIHQGDRVLLGLKKRGFGAGKWNGFGGKLETGESLTAAAVRECQEEAGITPTDIAPRGQLTFFFEKGLPELEVNVFYATEFTGEPHETEEMKPQWFPITEIPYDIMWADDTHWLPHVLSGKTVTGTFHFVDEATLKEHTVAVST